MSRQCLVCTDESSTSLVRYDSTVMIMGTLLNHRGIAGER